MTRISLVIPAYNEAQRLPALLSSVAAAKSRYRGGNAAIEVILADNASTDSTAAIAVEAGCQVVRVEQRRIAAARNGGARSATGDFLCFVDADSIIHPETFNAIDDAVSRQDIVGGATGVRLDRWSLGIALTYAVMVSLVFITGMDTGVVFCRRADFEEIGGYDERREFAEDVALMWALLRLGRGRGQKLTRPKDVKAVTSTRKFDRHGDWHFFTKIMPLALPALFRPAARTEQAQRYWYTDDR